MSVEINGALGMIETRGLIGSIEAADAMVKAKKRQYCRESTCWWRHCDGAGDR